MDNLGINSTNCFKYWPPLTCLVFEILLKRKEIFTCNTRTVAKIFVIEVNGTCLML